MNQGGKTREGNRLWFAVSLKLDQFFQSIGCDPLVGCAPGSQSRPSAYMPALTLVSLEIGAIPEATLFTGASEGLPPRPTTHSAGLQRFLRAILKPAEACRVCYQLGRGLQHHQECCDPLQRMRWVAVLQSFGTLGLDDSSRERRICEAGPTTGLF